jgi:predicted nucleic acid-binding protein
MTAARVLIDTGAIYAFVTRTDAHHRAAREFMETMVPLGGVFVLPDLVFAETMTLFKARLGSTITLRVGQELRRNPVYAWTALGPDGERETWATFQRYHDKEWSYTDCALLVISRRLGIPEIFGFDRHLAQMPGITRVP